MIFLRLAKSLILCVILFAFFDASAQDTRGVLTGTVIDSVTAKPVPYATASIFRVSDTTIITYRLSDDKGIFRIPLPIGVKSRLVITNMGNTVLRKEFTLTADKPTLDMGKIILSAKFISLSEVTIRAERPPVVVKKDTIEFNAAAFKTLPDALVEDLLRKLPGVNVDRNGNILVNGRQVSTIYVDGKDFFGGNIQMATKNLPANVIDKVQVTNDPIALKRDPYMADADIPQVINLKLKANVKKGAFGKLYAGGGSSEKYEGGGIINIFRDTSQISIIGYGNNVSKAGFGYNDVYNTGGFNRSGWNSYSTNGNGGFAINGISFGGTNGGLQTSAGGGANFNTMFKNDVSLNLQYFYGHINSTLHEIVNNQQFYHDTTLTSRRTTDQNGTSNSNNVAGRLKFKTDARTDFDFNPSISFNNNHTTQLATTNSGSNFFPVLNQSANNQTSQTNTFGYSSTLSIDHDYAKKGRNLSIFNSIDAGTSADDQYNQANNIFYQPASTSTLNQLRKNPYTNLDVRTTVRYAEPITTTLSLTANAVTEYLSNSNNIYTYYPDANGNYTNVIATATGNFDRNGWKNSLTAGIRYKSKDWTLNPGIKFNSVIIDNNFESAPSVKQRYFNILPSFSVTYKIFNLSYQVNFREPSAQDLQPVPNNTNPLYITYGNPQLKPALSNYLNMNMRKYDTKHSLSYNISINGSVDNNSSIRARTVNSNGIQTSIPVNVNGVWNFGNSLSFQKDKKFGKNCQLSFVTRNTMNYSRSVVELNAASSRYETLRLTPAAEFRLNLNDQFEFNQSYSISHSRSTYQSPGFTNISITYQDATTALVLRPDQNLVFESSMNYRYNSNTAPGLQNSYYLWNASVTYVFLKGRRGQLKLAVNDILDQNIDAYRSVRENYIQDTQSSTLRRYGLLTFTYNIRSFGEKVGGKNQLLRF